MKTAATWIGYNTAKPAMYAKISETRNIGVVYSVAVDFGLHAGWMAVGQIGAIMPDGTEMPIFDLHLPSGRFVGPRDANAGLNTSIEIEWRNACLEKMSKESGI